MNLALDSGDDAAVFADEPAMHKLLNERLSQ